MSKLKPAVSSKDHVQGNADAAIELVEYGDYECPHCGRAYPIIKRVQKKLGDKLKFVFRNFPLAEIHPHATNAAVATEAAAAQEKFWEMHDAIYENQGKMEDEDLIHHAQKTGLDIARFEADFEKESMQQKVEDDFESGVRSGVNGTPSFFINGEKYEDSWDEQSLLDFLAAIDD